MTDHVEVRRGRYHDSVALMQVSRAASGVEGVAAALVAMATELNLDLLDGLGFGRPEDVGANDLLVALRAADDDALGRGLAAVEQALADSSASRGGEGGSTEVPARTTGSAVRRSGAGLVLVSVPGPNAFVEAMDALEAGASVMVFSDNVPVEQEVRLKDEAAARGLLVMGPDCGTAVVDGVGLGFATVVRPGPVGLVAASGTGAQELMALLDAAEVGVSHCLGVGGRDLSSAVGGRSTLAALAVLDADPATEVIVVVSKPPAPEVADRVRAEAARLTTPVVFALLGPGQDDLTVAAERAVRAVGGEPPEWPAWLPSPAPGPRAGWLRGLFAGGTLCDEAMVVAVGRLGPVRSNIPLDPAWALPASMTADGDLMVDYGDDALTRGRAHPMIDPTLRAERLTVESADPSVGVLLLDVVLGHGADPDPAGGLAEPVRAAVRAGKAVVVSLCGSSGDPQGLGGQAAALRDAGAAVFLSNAQAARFAVGLVEGGRP